MNMKRLADFRRFSFVILLVFLTANLWGQSAAVLSGEGTEGNPWQITNTAEWNAFAAAVNGGYDYRGKYIKLMDDIEINVGAGDKMAGVFVKKGDSGNRPFN